MQGLIDVIAKWVELDPSVIRKLVESLIVILVLIVIRVLSVRLIDKHIVDVKRHYRWRRGLNYTIGVLGFLLIGRVWLEGLKEIGVFLGLASAGIAIALRDPLVSLAGWMFILLRRPFNVGDRIEFAGHVGDVIDIRIFQTVLMECGGWIDGDQATGRLMYIPNGAIFTQSIANYTDGFDYVWDEIIVRVTFESNWRRAKVIATELAEAATKDVLNDAREKIHHAANKHFIVFQKLTPIAYTSVKDFGIQLTLRYLCPARARRGTAQMIWEGLLDAFTAAPDIMFAHNTTRIFQHPTEGKPQLQPKPTNVAITSFP